MRDAHDAISCMGTRRQVVSVLVGAPFLSTSLLPVLASCSVERRISEHVRTAFFSSISELVIPATDTPGAIGAGVVEYLQMLWSERILSIDVDEVFHDLDRQTSAHFLELPAWERAKMIYRLDGMAFTTKQLHGADSASLGLCR